MKIFQQIVNHKINHLTVKELLKYSKEYKISLTDEQAQQLISLIKEKPVNIYDTNERHELIKKVARITNAQTAKKVQQLLQDLMK
ncbi:Mn-dependent DtxR family transcriptional regulator [Bacillus fengqiuensis]|nr:Mn-dependent DtxR family transcriptional regulator [Bacillus fengqiuensis]